MADSDLGIGALQKFRTISVVADLANDHISPIVLNAGDIEGRRLSVNLTQHGYPIAEAELPAANLIWNPDKDNPASAGGSTPMDIINEDGVIKAVEADVPRDLLANAGANPLLGVELVRSTSPKRIVTTRNIPVFIEPSPFNAEAPAIMDPLKELHDAVDSAKDAATKAGQAVERANQVIDTANILGGTTTTLKPNQPASSELSGSGLTRTLNLGLPRGASIASITATTATGSTPTVATDTNADGDLTVSLGIPRGEKGDPGSPGQPGPKGDPGDAGQIASSTVAGVVKVGSGLAITNDGTLSATAQDQPPATENTLGIVVPSSGLMISKEGALSVRAGDGLKIDPDDDAAVAVKFGAGLGITSDRTLIASGSTVLLASSEDGKLHATLTCPSPDAPQFLFMVWGETVESNTAIDFGDAVYLRLTSWNPVRGFFEDGTFSSVCQVASITAGTSITVAGAGSSAGRTFWSIQPMLVENLKPSSASAAELKAAASGAKPAATLGAIVDWSKLR